MKANFATPQKVVEAVEAALAWALLRDPADTQIKAARAGAVAARRYCEAAKLKFEVVELLQHAARWVTDAHTADTVLKEAKLAAFAIRQFQQHATEAADAATGAVNQSASVIVTLLQKAESQAGGVQQAALEAKELEREASWKMKLTRRCWGKRKFKKAKEAAVSVDVEAKKIAKHNSTLKLEAKKAMLFRAATADNACKAAAATQKHARAAQKYLEEVKEKLSTVGGVAAGMGIRDLSCYR